jgi:hypothetical protein
MNEELQKQLASLASKLGTTSEHLWGVLIRQAYIEAISSLCTVVVCLILAAAAIYCFVSLQRRYKEVSLQELRLSMWPPPEYIRWFILGVVLFFLLLVASSNFYWLISDMFNPEYFALKALPFVK